MVLFTAVGIFVVVIALVKLFLFFRKGGTFTQVARNATHLYCQILKVYPKLGEYTSMYMALMINSTSARREMPETLIKTIIQNARCAKSSWTDVVCMYTEYWFNNVGRTSAYKFGVDAGRDMEIARAVANAACDIADRGSTRYELMLRSLSQFEVLAYALKFDGGKFS